MNRVGVSGWSFGGYFAAMAAIRRPDIFRCAVVGAATAASGISAPRDPDGCLRRLHEQVFD
ncbi:MAG: prolyl oligopeptidase family serine peptidase [Verrucomicrobiota bacterium]